MSVKSPSRVGGLGFVGSRLQMFYSKRTLPSGVETLLSLSTFNKVALDRNPSPIGNVISTYLISGLDLALLITTTVFIPALATKEDFGSYRRIVIYAGYAGFLHFGVLNGLYLMLLGKSIGQEQIRLASAVRRLLLLLQVLIVPLGCLLLLCVVNGPNQKIVILAVAIAWVGSNVTTFHNYFWQATNNFGAYVKVNGASRIISLIVVGAIIIYGKVSTVSLAILFVLPILTSAGLYELVWRRVVTEPERAPQDIGPVWKRGVVLFGANIATSLLFTSDKLCLSWMVRPDIFASYALAYTLTNAFATLTESLGSALVPHLARPEGRARNDWVTFGLQSALISSSAAAFWVSSAVARRLYPGYTDLNQILWPLACAAPFSVFLRLCINARAVAFGMEARLLRLAISGAAMMLITAQGTLLFTTSLRTMAIVWSAGILLTAMIGWIYIGRCFRGDDDAARLFRTAVISTMCFVACSAYPNQTISFVLYATCVVLQILCLVGKTRNICLRESLPTGCK